MYILRISFQSVQKINQFKNIKITNFFNIKKNKKIFTVLKSPHVNKKSREHFIYKNYTKKVDLSFHSIYHLINFLILLKKKLNDKFLIKTRIIKKSICL
jgi:ribosomal protein S10